MKTFLFLLVALLCFFTQGCKKANSKKEFQPNFHYLGASESSLIQNYGEPTGTYRLQEKTKAEILEYEDGSGFQIEKGVVVAKNRPAGQHEKNLQYWRRKYAGYRQYLDAAVKSGEKNQQEPNRLLQLRIPKAGRSLLYDADHDVVLKVIEYAPKP